MGLPNLEAEINSFEYSLLIIWFFLSRLNREYFQ